MATHIFKKVGYVIEVPAIGIFGRVADHVVLGDESADVFCVQTENNCKNIKILTV